MIFQTPPPPSDTVNVFCLFLTSSPAVPADIMCPILELHQVSHITLKILKCRWLEIYYIVIDTALV